MCLLILGSSTYGHSFHSNTYQVINDEKCSVYYTMGYKYQHWFSFNATADNTTDVGNGNQSVFLKFYVQALSDAHVMLTSEPQSFGYEIVLGGGANSFCDLRRSSRMTSMVTLTTPKILYLRNPTGFWIRFTQSSGLIEIGKVGENLPFIFWTDPTPIPVKYFSFSAWDGVVCKWLYNCQSTTPSEKTNNIEKFLTYTERLRRDVLKNRGMFDFGSPPTNTDKFLNVTITNDFKSIHLDVMTSTLTLQGFATFEWMDNSINWDPKNYKNLSKLHLSNYELWQPELVLLNSLDPAKNIYSETKISVDNIGNVIWRPKFSMKTKCDIHLKSWPWDQHKCTLLLSTWLHKISNIFYQIKENDKSKCAQVVHSDWRLDKITSSYVDDTTPWDNIVASIKDDDSEDSKQLSLQIVVEISRNTKFLEKLFYAPLILISCLWLSSFCLMPDSSSKITIISMSMIFTILVIAYMTIYVPIFTESPPNLLLGYLKLALLMSTDAFVTSFLITVHRRKTTVGHPPFALTRFLTTPAVARLLMLPKLDVDCEVYGHLDDSDAAGAEPCGTAATAAAAATTLWDIVVVACERIVFIAYFAIAVAVVRSSA